MDYLLLRGELVGDVDSERIKADLERHRVDDGVQTICVDLYQVDRVTLDGLAILIELWEESRDRGNRYRRLRSAGASSPSSSAARIPAKVVSETLGHAGAGITLDTYSHVVPGMQEEAASKVAPLIFPRG